MICDAILFDITNIIVSCTNWCLCFWIVLRCFLMFIRYVFTTAFILLIFFPGENVCHFSFYLQSINVFHWDWSKGLNSFYYLYHISGLTTGFYCIIATHNFSQPLLPLFALVLLVACTQHTMAFYNVWNWKKHITYNYSQTCTCGHLY